tara:strand:+ start:108 stop:770 length:663 start_codon:yes stop_codon:yes gene_type:complete
LQIISDLKESDNKLNNKINSFSKQLDLKPFFLLIKPNLEIYKNAKLIDTQIENLIKKGFRNIEISWSDDENWFNYVSRLKMKFPSLNLGSASIINKQSIDESIAIGLKYSMMKFWDKDLLSYSNSKDHLLIPGIKNINDLKNAIDSNCKIVKIYPVKEQVKLINISQYKNIDFIAAGGLSISDLPLYKSLGYRGIVIGNRGFINKRIDRKIYQWLKDTSN